MEPQEVLEKLHPKEMVYLGCKNGSGFIDIDYAGTLITELDELNAKFARRLDEAVLDAQFDADFRSENLHKLKKKLSDAKAKLERLLSDKEKYQKALDGIPKEECETRVKMLEMVCPPLEEIADEIEACEKKIADLENSIESASSALNNAKSSEADLTQKQRDWKSIKSRRVIDVYHRHTDISGTAVLIEGDLCGYWFYHEKEGKRGRISQNRRNRS